MAARGIIAAVQPCEHKNEAGNYHRRRAAVGVRFAGRLSRSEDRTGRSMQRIDAGHLPDHRAARGGHLRFRIHADGLGETVDRLSPRGAVAVPWPVTILLSA